MTNPVVVSTSRITLYPEKRKEFLQTVGRLLQPMNETRGCMTFRCYVDATDENSSLLLGEWESESDLNNYLRSNDFAILRGAITVLSERSTDIRALVTEVTSPLKKSSNLQ
jgi:quinol monooxygenase YgiN